MLGIEDGVGDSTCGSWRSGTENPWPRIVAWHYPAESLRLSGICIHLVRVGVIASLIHQYVPFPQVSVNFFRRSSIPLKK